MKKEAFRAAFPHTIPVMTGYLFLGMAYGIYMRVSGFPFWYPLLTSVIVYGGSLEFLLVTILLAPYAPLATFLMALMLQARHLFYGLAMLDRYKHLGKKRYYLIYALTDETFSVNCSTEVPEGIDEGWFMFFISILDHFYWIFAATMGGILGSFITFDTGGIEFVMTAMFTVIFVEQLLKEKDHYSSIIGLICSIVCLVVFGKDRFLIPAMILIMLALGIRRPLGEGGRS